MAGPAVRDMLVFWFSRVIGQACFGVVCCWRFFFWRVLTPSRTAPMCLKMNYVELVWDLFAGCWRLSRCPVAWMLLAEFVLCLWGVGTRYTAVAS